jgi:exodeoxyribonuclease VII large subunit
MNSGGNRFAISISSRTMSEPAIRPNLPEYSVSEIAAALKRIVEGAFPFVRVRGEISGLKFHSSGHIYFDLKDEKAVLNAVVWRATALTLKQKPEQGLEVICTGRISTYAGSSRYQLIVEQLELAGLGALMALIEERKKKLAAEGLFAESRKKKLPFLPDVIGVVTSPTGAVIRDIMHRLDARFPRRVLLWPVAVQGERAAAEVAAAICGFNALAPQGTIPRPDVLIVARGGGSIEDLMAFNEEIVVRAVAESAIPVISAVGHETDTTLIDFAADRRAPTPTAAAEMAVPVRTELLALALDFERRNLRCFSNGLEDRHKHLVSLARALPRADQFFAAARQRFDQAAERLVHGLKRNAQEHRRAFLEVATPLRPGCVTSRIEAGTERVRSLAHRLERCERAHLKSWRDRLESSARLLDTVSHRAVLERGFALVRGAGGSIRRRAAAVSPGENLSLVFADGTAEAKAKGTGSGTGPSRAKPEQGKLL